MCFGRSSASRTSTWSAAISERPHYVCWSMRRLDDLISCRKAVEGVDGTFLVTDFYQEDRQDTRMDVEV